MVGQCVCRGGQVCVLHVCVCRWQGCSVCLAASTEQSLLSLLMDEQFVPASGRQPVAGLVLSFLHTGITAQCCWIDLQERCFSLLMDV